MSGLNEGAHGAELAALGVTEVLMKPFDGPELLTRLHRLRPDA